MKQRWTKMKQCCAAAFHVSSRPKQNRAPLPLQLACSTLLLNTKIKLNLIKLRHRARKQGVLPLVSLMLAGHPYYVDRGRLWVFVG